MENKRDYASQCNPHTVATFQAFVDAVIPRTPKLAKTLGPEFVSGALDLQVDQYLIWELDHSVTIQGYFIPKRIVLSEPTAYLLDAAATHLIATGRAKYPHHELKFPGGGTFAALARSDRFRAITLLESLDIDLGCLPQPFQK